MRSVKWTTLLKCFSASGIAMLWPILPNNLPAVRPVVRPTFQTLTSRAAARPAVVATAIGVSCCQPWLELTAASSLMREIARSRLSAMFVLDCLPLRHGAQVTW